MTDQEIKRIASEVFGNRKPRYKIEDNYEGQEVHEAYRDNFNATEQEQHRYDDQHQ